MHSVFCLVAFFIAGNALAQKVSQPEVAAANDLKDGVKENRPFAGRWKVVSQTHGSDVVAIPNNDIFLSSGLFAEYDRINNPAEPTISLWNIKWTGKAPNYSTKLFASPPSKIQTERFSEKNIAAFCYLQIRGDSAVLVISELKIDQNPFVTDGIAVTPGAARILTLFRISNDPQSRQSHLKSFVESMAATSGLLPSGAETVLVDPIHGGFLEECKSLSDPGK